MAEGQDDTFYAKMVDDLRYSMEENNKTVIQFTSQLEAKQKELDGMRQQQLAMKDKEIELLRREMDVLRQGTEGGGSSTAGGESSSLFSFRDIEESMNTFSGSDNYTVVKWFEDFEQSCLVFGWNETQKLVYAKKLLRGAAKMSMKTGADLSSWRKFKKFLREEFEVTNISADVHRRMMQRQKESSETLQEYLLAMRALGSLGDIDEESIIKYVIAGIDDIDSNKIILFGSTGMADFKNKLVIYEEYKNSSTNSRKTVPNSPEQQRIVPLSRPSRCYNCGDLGHISRECQNRNIGAKCYKCNKFGHISPNCPQLNEGSRGNRSTNFQQQQRIAMVSNEQQFLQNDMLKKVAINGYELIALIDTGSDLSLIREDVWQQIGNPTIVQDNSRFRGIGPQENRTLGSFSASVGIDQDVFIAKLCVVSNDLFDYQVLIGRDILRDAEVFIRRNEVRIKKVEPENFIAHVQLNYENEISLSHIRDKKYVHHIQKVIDDYDPRSRKTSSIMRTSDDIKIKEVIQQEIVESFENEREEQRQHAKHQIAKIQAEIRRTYSRRRKPAHTYCVGNLVAVRRTQFGMGTKLNNRLLGPYKVTAIKPNDRYNIEKDGYHEGSNCTSSSADNMKLFNPASSDNDDSSNGKCDVKKDGSFEIGAYG
jgi:Retroviral aspartyl protease/Zinc knuckle